MSSSFFDTLTLEQQRQLDRLCDAFEQGWAAGSRPPIEPLLAAFADEHRPTLLLELVQLEVQLRRQLAERPSLTEYQRRFPDQGDALAALSCFGPTAEASVAQEDTQDDEALPTLPGHELAARPGEQPTGTSSVELRTGSQLGSYRILDKVGQGGMGEVYRVAHQLIDCHRALKTLRPQLASHPEAVKRFLQEAQVSVRRLTHPNLVAVYDVGREGDTVYLVMELVDGVDLCGLVESEGPLAPDRAVEIIRQAAAGLQFAHERGCVHRDIKPHNIMVTRRGEVKILDLGLVRVLDRPEAEFWPGNPAEDDESPFQQALTLFRTRLTDDRALVGTLPYMAPEQAADAARADVLSDIYSLGCTFYYLLTGEHAFSGSSAEEVLRKHLNGDFLPLRHMRPEVPEALEQIVSRMLHRDRQQRYASAAQVQEALEHWTTGPPTRVRLKDAHALQRGLIHLGLISEDDWRTAVSVARRPQRTTWTPEYSGTGDFGPTAEEPHPALILQKLQELQNSRGGQKYGLSEFQARTILNENADLLRLPHHVLLDQIGGGWKGDLFKARNVVENRTETVRLFPIKSLLGFAGGTDERLQRFNAHVETLRAISHPNLARVYGGEQFEHRLHGATAVLAGEYVVGESLENYIATRRTESGSGPSLKRIVELAAAIARGLHGAHESGVLHLDITARSLRFDRQRDELRLTDLGVAVMVREMPDEPAARGREWRQATAALASPRMLRRSHADTLSATITAPPLAPVGTPEVLAPELFRDPRAVSPAADLYSFGCCLFYLLTGSYPFVGDETSSIMLGHLTKSPWSSPAAKLVPTPFQPVLDRLLAKEPADRCSSAAELAEALDDLLRSANFSADAPVAWSADSAQPPPTAPASPTRWWQRVWTRWRRS